jgi:hypothetical protein
VKVRRRPDLVSIVALVTSGVSLYESVLTRAALCVNVGDVGHLSRDKAARAEIIVCNGAHGKRRSNAQTSMTRSPRKTAGSRRRCCHDCDGEPSRRRAGCDMYARGDDRAAAAPATRKAVADMTGLFECVRQCGREGTDHHDVGCAN